MKEKNSFQTATSTQVQRNYSTLFRQVQRGKPVVVLRRNKPRVVILSYKNYLKLKNHSKTLPPRSKGRGSPPRKTNLFSKILRRP